ncbi:MAG TPA: hypothetical protein VMV77_07170 [Bacteroidales bacterium]|nr:hypothetical protein [Bacteroidales bacterium]
MSEKTAQSVRCQAENHLKHNQSGGNMVMILEGNSIYAKCGHGTCQKWTRLTLSIPGVDLDFTRVAYVQETLPKTFKVGNSCPPVPPKRIPVVVIGEN